MDWKGGYPFFNEEELECKCACGMLPQHELMVHLVDMREEAGFPFIISSGARCAEHNKKVSNTGPNGPHVQGLAVDIKVYGARALRVIELALKYGATGVGVSQKGPYSSRYIHVDWVPGRTEKTIWSY